MVIFFNRLYDITNFTHPGGAYILKMTNFTEISKYLNGAAGLDKNESIAWKHSKDAFRMLETYFIGDLSSNDG
jgi:cytochrome b involved in lipid metabolism